MASKDESKFDQTAQPSLDPGGKREPLYSAPPSFFDMKITGKILESFSYGGSGYDGIHVENLDAFMLEKFSAISGEYTVENTGLNERTLKTLDFSEFGSLTRVTPFERIFGHVLGIIYKTAYGSNFPRNPGKLNEDFKFIFPVGMLPTVNKGFF